MEMLTRKKKLLLDRNLSRLLANLTIDGSVNFFCSAATLITRYVKRLCPYMPVRIVKTSKERFDSTKVAQLSKRLILPHF